MNRLTTLLIIPLFYGCIGTDFIDVNLEQLEITNPIVSLAVGERYTLNPKYTNQIGEETSVDIIWSSSDDNIATVNSNGVVTGVAFGKVTILFVAGGTQGNLTFDITAETVMLIERSTSLQGSNDYIASGTARLYIDNNNELILEFDSDFNTDFALGTFIYLANSISGQEVKASGLDLGQVTTGGAHTFNITLINNMVGINTYNYVVVLCKPAGITFGYGKLY